MLPGCEGFHLAGLQVWEHSAVQGKNYPGSVDKEPKQQSRFVRSNPSSPVTYVLGSWLSIYRYYIGTKEQLPIILATRLLGKGRSPICAHIPVIHAGVD